MTQGDGSDALGSYKITKSDGSFDLDYSYDCTAGGKFPGLGSEDIYLYVAGGDTGSGTNAASGLLAAVGSCTAPYASKIAVDEITTVGTAFALAGFATDATHIGDSGTTLGAQGLHNAFLNTQNLFSLEYGTAATATVGNNGTPPTATLTTLADMLAACVNTAGSTAAGAACNTLFSYTQTGGATGTAASDTATAAINLAHNPYPTSAGMTALYGLVPSTGAPYAGGLSAQPNDFTLALSFSGGGLVARSTSVAIDGQGNAWVGGFYVSNGSRTGVVSQFSPTGAALSPAGGYGSSVLAAATGLALDTGGNVWVADAYNGGISELSSAGVLAAWSPHAAAQAPSVAIDAAGNAWFSQNGSTDQQLGALSSAGVSLPNSPYGGVVGQGPGGVALDGAGNLWVGTSTDDIGVVKYATAFSYNMGIAVTSYINSASQLPSTASTGTSVDATGQVWLANAGQAYGPGATAQATITRVNPSTGVLTNFTGGGLNTATATAVDGAGDIWVSNNSGTGTSAVSEFSNAGVAITPTTGYTAGGTLSNMQAIAVDGSGNVWVPNNLLNNTTISPHVTELVGAAAPVMTPICAGLPAVATVDGSSRLGTRP